MMLLFDNLLLSPVAVALVTYLYRFIVVSTYSSAGLRNWHLDYDAKGARIQPSLEGDVTLKADYV